MIRNQILLTTFLNLLLIGHVISERPEKWPSFAEDLPELECDQDSGTLCTRKNPITTGFKYIKPGGSLFFDGVYANLNPDECRIYIKADNVWFVHSNFIGCDIIIEAPQNFKLLSSSLSVNGTKIRGKGYSNDPERGHSYGGAGGYCKEGLVPDFTYGEFTTPYYEDELAIGSGGNQGSEGIFFDYNYIE